LKRKYTSVSIYIPKRDGKPCIEKECRWYVYFYIKNDDGTYKQIKLYHGINHYKTVRERLKIAHIIKEAAEKFLAEGGDPLSMIETNFSFKNAVIDAFGNKKKEWSENTLKTNSVYLKEFVKWIENKKLSDLPIKDIRRRHLSVYINEIARTKSPTTVNNHIRFLSMIFGKMEQDDIIPYNIARDLKKLKTIPTKNEPFSTEQFNEIVAYLKENDPYMLAFIKFMGYTFLRPIEIVRLQMKDINLKDGIITIRTKTEQKSTIRIIDKLRDLLLEMDIENYPEDYFLFTKQNRPDAWTERKNEQNRYYYFKKRFSKHKKTLALKKEQGLYSFRHTFARMLYFKFLDAGMTDLESKFKLMTITRHKSLSSLNKYLRSIGAFLPDDFSNDLDI